MSWLDFFASLAGSLAWPGVVAFIVFLLRQQIRDLLPHLARIQAGDFTAEFLRGLEKAEELEQKVEEQKALPPIEETDESLIASRETLYARAKESPKEAVYNAWFLVQAEVWAAAKRNNLDRSSGYPLRRVVRMLADKGRVPPLLIDYADELGRLHKETLQTSTPITEDAATRYVEQALQLISYLKRA